MQVLQPVGKTRSKQNTKQEPQVTIREPHDLNRVFIKVNGHPALAVIDVQTIAGDLISAQLVYPYKLPIVKIETKTLATANKGSKRTVDKTCEVELIREGYQETRIFYVAYLSGWNIILSKHVLQDVRATIPAGTAPVTM